MTDKSWPAIVVLAICCGIIGLALGVSHSSRTPGTDRVEPDRVVVVDAGPPVTTTVTGRIGGAGK